MQPTEASTGGRKWWDRARPWRNIKDYNEWLQLWDAAGTFEEAEGLVHTLISDGRGDDPRAVRLLLEIADGRNVNEYHTCAPYGGPSYCPWHRIHHLARKIVFTRFLREQDSDPDVPPSWAVPFEQDADLLGTMLAFLLEQRFDLQMRGDKTESNTLSAFLRRWVNHDLWPRTDTWRDEKRTRLARVRTVRNQHRLELYRTALRLDLADEISDTSTDSLDTLRTLAFEESSPERRPRDIDEALVWTSGLNACHKQAAQRLLYLEHLARAKARKYREEQAARERR